MQRSKYFQNNPKCDFDKISSIAVIKIYQSSTRFWRNIFWNVENVFFFTLKVFPNASEPKKFS